MKTKRKKYFILIGLLIFTIFTLVYNFIRDEKLKKIGVYTICSINKVEGASRGMMINIEYNYKGKKIMNSSVNSTGDITRKDVGKRFLILIRSDEPDANYDMFLDKPVPDSIKEAPINGWKDIPF
ncbi:MAG: hypothetical protein WCP52_08280 [Bacteroidota bacterium]